jgi:cell filamentation protein
MECIQTLAKNYPNNRAAAFLDWLIYSDNSIDGQSKKKAYQLFERDILDNMRPGTIESLQQIHAYLFGGLYDFAGKIRTKTISKGGTVFCRTQYLMQNLLDIERMPDNNYDEILDKYIEMNMAHPFMEGNGRSTRIWLDLILKKSLKLCVDWSRIDKNAYMDAMRLSAIDPAPIKSLIRNALTDKINDREIFMKGIDYSYYYEQD